MDWIGGLHWRIGLVDLMVDWIGPNCRAIIIYLDANVFFSRMSPRITIIQIFYRNTQQQLYQPGGGNYKSRVNMFNVNDLSWVYCD